MLINGNSSQVPQAYAHEYLLVLLALLAYEKDKVFEIKAGGAALSVSNAQPSCGA